MEEKKEEQVSLELKEEKNKEENESDETWQTDEEESEEECNCHKDDKESEIEEEEETSDEENSSSSSKNSDEDTSSSLSRRSQNGKYEERNSSYNQIIVEEAKSRYYKLLVRKDNKNCAIIYDDKGNVDARSVFYSFYNNSDDSQKKILKRISDIEVFQIVFVKRSDFFTNKVPYEFECIDGDKREKFVKVKNSYEDTKIYSKEEVELYYLEKEKTPLQLSTDQYEKTYRIISNDIIVLKEGTLLELNICTFDEYFAEAKHTFNFLIKEDNSFKDLIRLYVLIAQLAKKDPNTESNSEYENEIKTFIDMVDSQSFLFF